MSNSETPSTGQQAGKSHSKLFGIIGIVGIVTAFFLASNLIDNLTTKFDTTEDKIYTLSDGTKEIVSTLPLEVKIRYYVSPEDEGLPTYLRDAATRFWRQLLEYEAASNGMIKLEKIEPTQDTEEEDIARGDGISPLFDQQTRDSYYFAVSLSAIGQRVNLPPLSNIPEESREYMITKAIAEVSTPVDEKTNVTIVTDLALTGSPMTRDPGNILFRDIYQRYEVHTVSPAADDLYDRDDNGKRIIPKAVIVVHPHNISPQMEYELDQYVIRGGRLLAFVDPAFFFAPRGGQGPFPGAPPTPATPQKSSLPTLFESWGINYSTDRFIADMSYRTQIGELPEDSPVVITLPSEAFNQQDPVMRDMANVISVLTGTLDGKAPYDAVSREVLASTSKLSSFITETTDPNLLPPNSPPPGAMLRNLDPRAHAMLNNEFEPGDARLIPVTFGLNASGIVGSVKSPDIPRKLQIVAKDAAGDDLTGTVSLVGSGTDGKQINEIVNIPAGEGVQMTKNVYAQLSSVSHNFGGTADGDKDSLVINGAPMEHPVIVRLSGKFVTAFKEGRPEKPELPEGHPSLDGGGIPGLPGGIPGLPGGLRGVEGTDGNEGNTGTADDNTTAEGTGGDEGSETGSEGEPAEASSGASTGSEGPDTPTAPDTPTIPDNPVPGTDLAPDAPSESEDNPAPETTDDGTGEEKPEPTEPEATDPESGEGTDLPKVDEPLESGEEEKEEKLPHYEAASKEGVVVIVADCDLLQNPFTVHQTPQGFIPHTVHGNFSLVYNLIDELMGDPRLIAVRSRASSRRPFTKIIEMEEAANEKMREQEMAIMKEIEDLQAKANEIASGGSEGDQNQTMQLIMSEGAKTEAAIKEKTLVLRELRKEKKREVREEIANIKTKNLAYVPIAVILAGLLVAIIRRSTTAAR